MKDRRNHAVSSELICAQDEESHSSSRGDSMLEQGIHLLLHGETDVPPGKSGENDWLLVEYFPFHALVLGELVLQLPLKGIQSEQERPGVRTEIGRAGMILADREGQISGLWMLNGPGVRHGNLDVRCDEQLVDGRYDHQHQHCYADRRRRS